MLTKRMMITGGLSAVLIANMGWASAPAQVVFLRHALAPGFGDPDNFQLGDCSTQRNLNHEGRAQAHKIGQALTKAGYRFDAIYSSQWCRCLETAKLLGVGPVTPFAGLNSFFQGHADRRRTLSLLNDKLSKLLAGKTALMVTHQVVIQAITGRSVPSGGGVIYTPAQAHSTDLTF